MSTKPLGNHILPDEVIKQDKKTCRKFDQCGIGDKAVYVPSKTFPRAYYISYESLERVYKRVAVSPGTGKAFLTPILYVVFQYDGGKEKEVYFKYLNEADQLFNDLEKTHPDVPLISQTNEDRQRAQEEEEQRIRQRQLERPLQNEVAKLESAKELLGMRPKLYRDLAGAATFKRKIDNIKPLYQNAAIGITIAGALFAAAGIYVYKYMVSNVGLLLAFVGIAAMFLMVNSKVLPTPQKNRKYANGEYDKALEAMRISLRKTPDFPLPYYYAHPVVCDRLIKIIRMDRARTVEEALAVLKEDLKEMDSSVQLGGQEYREVVTIKPMFLVQEYR